MQTDQSTYSLNVFHVRPLAYFIVPLVTLCFVVWKFQWWIVSVCCKWWIAIITVSNLLGFFFTISMFRKSDGFRETCSVTICATDLKRRLLRMNVWLLNQLKYVDINNRYKHKMKHRHKYSSDIFPWWIESIIYNNNILGLFSKSRRQSMRLQFWCTKI